MPYEFDPAGSPADELRFLLGDTVVESPLLADDEVDYLLATSPGTIAAAYSGALALVARFSARADISVGSARKSFTAQADAMQKVADSLAARGGKQGLPTATEAQRVGPPVASGLVTTQSPLVMLNDWSVRDIDTSQA